MEMIRSLVIVGGGTAGWMAAALFATLLPRDRFTITLVESEDIGTIGVGEATVPLLTHFNGLIGLDEAEFVRQVDATFKLGIAFHDWGEIGNVHFHGFGDHGDAVDGLPPHQHWLRLRRRGLTAPIDDWSAPWALARRNRFVPPPSGSAHPAGDFRHAYHLDAGRYAALLRSLAESRGVHRIEGRINQVSLNSETGNIESISLAHGTQISGDFFVDCSGQRALLIGDALNVPLIDWSESLPCNHAWTAPSARNPDPPPYTRSTARSSGWQWAIPLQTRTGNGYVFSSNFQDIEAAKAEFLDGIDSELLAEPRLISFQSGRRSAYWHKNCLGVGLSTGFLEPLESTSIQLIQTALARFIELFPHDNESPLLADEYNRLTIAEVERIRDFIILHYCLTRRDDSPLWQWCKTMPIPDSLMEKIALWDARGRVALREQESYQESSWVSIFLGNNRIPRQHDPLVDRSSADRVAQLFERRRQDISRVAERLPTHAEFLRSLRVGQAA